MTRPPRYRCRRCGATFTSWAKAQDHADAAGHPRLEIIL